MIESDRFDYRVKKKRKKRRKRGNITFKTKQNNTKRRMMILSFSRFCFPLNNIFSPFFLGIPWWVREKCVVVHSAVYRQKS